MAFRSVEKSPTLHLNELSNDIQRAGRQIYKFGFGQSPFAPLQRIQDALKEAVCRKDYAPVQGVPELRERIADFHSRTDGHHIHPDQVVVASGSKILLYNLLLAFEKAVLYLPAPSWVSYATQARLARHPVEFVATSHENRWRLDPADLDRALANPDYATHEKILILNYPGNPDGLVYTGAELEALANVLRKHKTWIMADEIYGLLHHKGEHVSIAKYYPEGTIVTNGMSKWCGAGGWRMGFQVLPATIPSDFRAAIMAIASATYSCAPTPMQMAAIQAYVWDETTKHYLQDQRRILSAIGQEIYQRVAASGIHVHAPQGAFYLLLDFDPMRESLAARGIRTDVELCTRLLEETGVALLQGSAFNNDETQLTARLAYVDFNGQLMLDKVSQQSGRKVSAGLLHGECQHMLEGTHALTEWIANL